ncbi:hypothetical protein [Rhodanobacter lindaniclasticus]
MKIAVHTDKGIFHVDAKNPKHAREIVAKKHDVIVSKVKVVGNQPRQ